MRILLVEDTPDVADAIAGHFARRGDALDCAQSAADAREFLQVQEYDVAVLDINLPDGSGLDLLSRLRREGRAMPVLMLTARIDVDDRVAALDGGADDYLTKPFDLRELEARLRALARRNSPDRGGVVRFGDLVFDPAGQTLEIGGQAVTLTRREYALLEALLANRGRVIAKERLHERLFSFNEDNVGLNAIEIYVARLRRKIEESRVSIRTLRGLGYQI
nr:response regulator transcription factor [Rhizobiaceae bacterium]